jgi:hypothetical protein
MPHVLPNMQEKAVAAMEDYFEQSFPVVHRRTDGGQQRKAWCPFTVGKGKEGVGTK